jgi:hypothetical protein
MRLLQICADGQFSLVEYTGNDIPPYAILSHTWGPDHEEVTFKDLAEGIGKNKLGFRKLTFCAKQAEDDGLQLFWVDTCCIDKSSSTELQEAINSMFQWYRKAARCYAYLSDVSVDSSTKNAIPPRRAWERSFRKSRWFKRGWTLQELLAPKSVDFFSAEGQRLGNRNSLSQMLEDVTKIPARALQGTPLDRFKIKERMSWAKGRATKREEDMAYSLLGIFGVYIPLIYGEGEQNAFARLRKEIEDKYQEIDSPESSWTDIIESRKRHGDCLNCGSEHHWERDCPKDCGKCITSDAIRKVYEG